MDRGSLLRKKITKLSFFPREPRLRIRNTASGERALRARALDQLTKGNEASENKTEGQIARCNFSANDMLTTYPAPECVGFSNSPEISG